MRRFSPILLIAVLLALSCGNLRAQVATDPVALVEWLRTLVIEARLDLKFPAEGRSPRLFTETVPDGRTWMVYIADTLGTAAGGNPSQPNVPNQWALLDQAVSVALAEADTMRALAAARVGTAAEAQFQTMRRNYLAGAARMLQAYKVAAGDVFDATAGASPNPFGLPDWLLPGEIQLKEIGGAGRLNTDSGDFSGRLSGTMVLPGLGATLMVPNASFDSDGRFDLSAYGNL